MRRLKRWLRGPTAVLVLYAAVALNPSLLFAHELRVENLVLHSREPLPPEARTILQAAHDRAAKSPYFDASDSYDLYLCDTPALFTFFVPWARNVGAVSLMGVTGNIYVRPANVTNDRLIGPHGKEVPGVRTLTYYFAHEVTHTAMARKLGRVAYFQRPSWMLEGYADLIGKGGAFDFEAERTRFRNGDVELDYAKSGLYLRYQLFVEALLREGVSLEEMPNADLEQLERRLRQ
ncbi:MAG: hypothetical protein JNM69_41690 [Archangium sp.]|nr:hypothetical protein [Archangium sp.]